MRLLVTGANGFLGRNVLLALPHSWEVAALYRPGNRDFLAFLDDAVHPLLAVLNKPPIENVRCIDLGMGSGDTINEIVTRAAHLFGLEPIISYEGASPEYIQFVIDPEPFKLAYQFTPTTTLEEGLSRLAAHLREREER
jgi:nucleoside-diphosphate-sugar epimerase